MDELICRIDKLERESKRWRTLSVVLGAFVSLVCIIGAAEQRITPEVRAQRFVLVDEGGKQHAELGLRPDGKHGLRLYDESGTTIASFSLSGKGAAGIAFADKRGVFRSELDTSPDGGSQLRFYDDRGGVGAAVSLGPEGSATLHLREKEDKMGALQKMLRESIIP